MQKITSRENVKLKLARRVRDGREKNLIFVEGVRLAEEALRSKLQVKEIFLAEDFARDARAAELLKALQTENRSISEVPENLFHSIADTKNSQGVILLCEKPRTEKSNFAARISFDAALPVVVLLHEVNNPANLGAILRTAEAVDAAGVIISQRSADVFSPKSLRASMGAGFRLNLWTNADFEDVLSWARREKLISTAADVNAAKSYTDIDWRTPRLLVFGSEAHGLDAVDFRKIDEGLIIPMKNGVESLNLAVACGVILFEAVRQNKNRPV